MLKLNLHKVLDYKGIDNPNRFLRKNGFTAHTASRLLNNNVEGINFKHLEQLCTILHCLPSDLFEWLPNDKNFDKEHPLQKLKPQVRNMNITNKLKKLPLDKLDQVVTLIERLSQYNEVEA